MRCETELNPCERTPTPCGKRGDCKPDTGSGYTCECFLGYKGQNCTDDRFWDCADIYARNIKTDDRRNGVKQITRPRGQSMWVYCDMESADSRGVVGGWTVFQSRVDGTSFDKTWTEYEAGFATSGFDTSALSGSYWLGLTAIHDLLHDGANTRKMKMRVDLTECMTMVKGYEEYDDFSIEDQANNYRVHVGDKSYFGSAHDAFTTDDAAQKLDGMEFSTKDKDNDKFPGSCAKTRKGGWWYNSCGAANLNGNWYPSTTCNKAKPDGIYWKPWYQDLRAMFQASMKIRPMNFNPK